MTVKTEIASDRVRAELIAAAVALEFGLPHFEAASPLKGPSEISFARQAAMYLLHVVFELNFSRVGRAFCRDRSTAGYACRVIEDSRDDPLFDQKLAALELFLSEAPLPSDGV